MADEGDDLAFDEDEKMFRYGEKAEITHEQLILQAMKHCMEEGSKEMRGGYTKEKTNAQGKTEVIYVDDQRKVYIQSIMSLHDIMIPKFDKKFREDELIFDKSIDEIKKRAIDIMKLKLSHVEEREKIENVSYQDIKDNLSNQITTERLDPDSLESQIVMDGTIKAYRTLYQALIALYGREGFGTAKEISDA